MKVKLLKDWGDHLKDSELEIDDISVLIKGNELGVFKLSKEQLKSFEVVEEIEVKE